MIELHATVPSVLMPGTPIDPDTAEAIEIIADLEGMTPSMLVRRALRAWACQYMLSLPD